MEEEREQLFRELQTRIEQRFVNYFRDDLHQIEYKPQNVLSLLGMPAMYREGE